MPVSNDRKKKEKKKKEQTNDWNELYSIVNYINFFYMHDQKRIETASLIF